MKILVVGGGLIGVATAYCLARDGHSVTTIDRQNGPGQETSFANGALLHPSMPEPWNSPGCWRTLLSSFVRPDAALKLRLKSLPSIARWGAEFLRNSRVGAFERNSLSNLRLASYSLVIMRALREETGIEYGRVAKGSLRIFRDPRALDSAAAIGELRSAEGLAMRRLSRTEILQFEPGLTPIADQLTGAIHYEADEVGDAHRFCVALTESAKRLGVNFLFNTTMNSFETDGRAVTGVICSDQRLTADLYVMAAGSYSPLLARTIKVELPVRPAKGYSVTVGMDAGAVHLRIPIIDDQLHAAIVPLGNRIRVAGTAEFAGYDLELRPNRIRNLLALLSAVLPNVTIDSERVSPWCGLRPLCADGVPIIGTTRISNLWLNTGHGHLGWTMAAGSARLLADMLGAKKPDIDPKPYCLSRFQ